MPRGKPYDPMLISKVKALHAKGLAQNEIATALGVEYGLVYRIARRSGIKTAINRITAGKTYGRLIAIRRTGTSEKLVTPLWAYRCKCGQEVILPSRNVLNGNTKSCGCLRDESRKSRTKHGHAREYLKTKEYRAWNSMRCRCLFPSTDRYPSYGGRGIKVCDRWNRFENFLSDMGPAPSPRHTIERRDTDGNYEPSNCYWALPEVQCRNRRTNHYVSLNGEIMTLTDACRAVGIPITTVSNRLRRGLSLSEAMGIANAVSIRKSLFPSTGRPRSKELT